MSTTATATEIVAPAGTTAAVLKDQFHFAAAYRVGDVIELSGQTGHLADLSLPDTVEAEIDQAFRNVESVLVSAGLDWSAVYALRTYHVVEQGAASIPEEALGAVLSGFAAHLGDRHPVWTAIAVPALAFAGMRIEIEVKAVI